MIKERYELTRVVVRYTDLIEFTESEGLATARLAALVLAPTTASSDVSYRSIAATARFIGNQCPITKMAARKDMRRLDLGKCAFQWACYDLKMPCC